LRGQRNALRQLTADAVKETQTWRDQLSDVRRGSRQLARTVDVLTAPDLLRVDLAATPNAAGATGRAFWSRSRGLLFNADRLPRLQTGRVYQLWLVLPNKGGCCDRRNGRRFLQTTSRRVDKVPSD